MTRISSGAPWEDRYGYSRAVVAGPALFVAGTTATVEGQVVAVGDPYLQAVTAFGIALDAVREAGFELADVVRTRMFVADIDDQEAIGRAHRELFDTVRPAATMVQVAGFAHPDHLIEVEIDAYRRP